MAQPIHRTRTRASVSERPEYLNLKDSADYTGLAQRTLRRYIAEGGLAAYKVGARQIRIRRDDLDALFTPIPTTRTAS